MTLRYCPVLRDGVRFARMEAVDGRAEIDELVRAVLDEAGFDAALGFRYALELSRKANQIDYAVYQGAERIARVRPRSAEFEFREGTTGPLSRFACLHREGGVLVLESPMVEAAIELEAPLGHPGVAELLAATGFVESDEERAAPGALWEFHDLLFHRRSRLSADRRVGATWRLAGIEEPPAALKRAMGENAIRLEVPRVDSPFQKILERRRSLRTPGARAITARELAEFLYRSVGVREPLGDAFHRPYPSGGGIHEMEYYAALHRCDGLERGFYHYRAVEHALYRLDVGLDDVDRVIGQAVNSWGAEYPAPDVVVTLAARVPRMAFKYEAMAYRTILINAGCAIQTMYLVATEMKLAACAIGNGDPALFARVTGVPVLEETSVAEFALSGGG